MLRLRSAVQSCCSNSASWPGTSTGGDVDLHSLSVVFHWPFQSMPANRSPFWAAGTSAASKFFRDQAGAARDPQSHRSLRRRADAGRAADRRCRVHAQLRLCVADAQGNSWKRRRAIFKSNIRIWAIGLQIFATGSLPRSGLVQRTLWNVGRGPPLLRLDVGSPDHLAPLLGFLGDKLGEVGGRAGKHRAGNFRSARIAA
jgi:hypothetical protein